VTSLVKYNIAVAGVKTSISLEEPFWVALKDIAARRQMTVNGLVGEIDSRRRQGKLSSEIRMFVLEFYRSEHTKREKGEEPRK
jgi:predicted DNA-binding ribbon-helix-helix protein